MIHSFPGQQDQVYEALLGKQSLLTGASAQNSWKAAHQQTLKWVRASAAARRRPWLKNLPSCNSAVRGML